MSTPARRRLMRDFKRSDSSHKRLCCIQVVCTESDFGGLIVTDLCCYSRTASLVSMVTVGNPEIKSLLE